MHVIAPPPSEAHFLSGDTRGASPAEPCCKESAVRIEPVSVRSFSLPSSDHGCQKRFHVERSRKRDSVRLNAFFRLAGTRAERCGVLGVDREAGSPLSRLGGGPSPRVAFPSQGLSLGRSVTASPSVLWAVK